VKRKDLVKKLRAAGYREVRNNSHAIFEKANGRPLQVPNHKEINENTAKEILRQAGIE
jgi:mRNA interferase HicA